MRGLMTPVAASGRKPGQSYTSPSPGAYDADDEDGLPSPSTSDAQHVPWRKFDPFETQPCCCYSRRKSVAECVEKNTASRTRQGCKRLRIDTPKDADCASPELMLETEATQERDAMKVTGIRCAVSRPSHPRCPYVSSPASFYHSASLHTPSALSVKSVIPSSPRRRGHLFVRGPPLDVALDGEDSSLQSDYRAASIGHSSCAEGSHQLVSHAGRVSQDGGAYATPSSHGSSCQQSVSGRSSSSNNQQPANPLLVRMAQIVRCTDGLASREEAREDEEDGMTDTGTEIEELPPDHYIDAEHYIEYAERCLEALQRGKPNYRTRQSLHRSVHECLWIVGRMTARAVPDRALGLLSPASDGSGSARSEDGLRRRDLLSQVFKKDETSLYGRLQRTDRRKLIDEADEWLLEGE